MQTSQKRGLENPQRGERRTPSGTTSSRQLPQRGSLKKLLLFPSPQALKPCAIKNVLRFELHLRLCFGKADGARKFCLELLRGFRDSSRIAFFRTFFSKKKVHKGMAVAGNFCLDDSLSFCKSPKTTNGTGYASGTIRSFRHFLTKMPPPSSRRSLQGRSARLQISLKEGG